MNQPKCDCFVCREAFAPATAPTPLVEPVKKQWVLRRKDGSVWFTEGEYTRAGADSRFTESKVVGVFTPAAAYDPLPEAKPEPKT